MYKAAVNFLRGQVLVHIESGCPERAVTPSAARAVRMVRRIRAQLASLAAPGTSAVTGI